jgi:hypothetical protein
LKKTKKKQHKITSLNTAQDLEKTSLVICPLIARQIRAVRFALSTDFTTGEPGVATVFSELELPELVDVLVADIDDDVDDEEVEDFNVEVESGRSLLPFR